MKSIKITMSGKVQGVGFRMFVKQQAQKLGVLGFVKNQRDGTIEIVCSHSNPGKLNLFIREARRGPLLAHISNIREEPLESEEFDDFEIR